MRGGRRVAHEELRAVKTIAVTLTLCAQRDARGTPRGVRLRDRHGQHRLATRDMRKDGTVLLLGACFHHRQGAEHAGAEERSRQRAAAELLVQHRRVGGAALAAAVLRRNQNAEPARV